MDTPPFVHKQTCLAKRFGHDDRFSLSQVQPLVLKQKLNYCRIWRLGKNNPLPESRENRLPDRIAGAPLDNFMINRGRDHNSTVDLAK
jgi:hypothetical protein